MAKLIPTKVANNLKSGGTNLSFPFYEDWNENSQAQHKAALSEMYAKGLRHIRITMSMNNFEDVAKTGKLREDRWLKLLDFVLEAIRVGLTPIIDNHNTGLRGDDNTGDWESDYMGDLRSAAVRTRHISLMKAFAQKIQNDARLVDEAILTPANEPIFDGSTGAPSVWWNHQRQLIPAIRSVAPDVMVTYMAQDWNGLEAFINNWDTQMKVFAQGDPRLIADIHFYEPVESFTHVANATNKYPGTMTTWRGTKTWNKDFLRTLIKPLYDFAKAKNLPLVLISEYGTDKKVDKASRLRYMTDLTDLFREYGFGHTAYTWSYGDNFQINEHGGYGDNRIWDVVTEPIGTPEEPEEPEEPTDPEEPEEPTEPEIDGLSDEERAAVDALIKVAVDRLNARITELETRLAVAGDKMAAALRAYAEEVDRL